MKEIRTDYTFLEPLDPFMPKWTQIDKERTVYEGFECKDCGKIYADKPAKCDCGHTEFHTVEVDENLEPVIYEEDGGIK